MFFHGVIFFNPLPLKNRMKWLRDGKLLDMINKLHTGVNVSGYTLTGWPTVIDYSQCDATRHITMLIQSALTWCGLSEKSERVQTIKTVWVWGGERETKRMAARQCDHSEFVCTPVCPNEQPVIQKRQPPWSPSALTALLVIGMTFENILAEDERLNSRWADLSTAKLQLERMCEKSCKSKLSEYVICLLAVVLC